MANLTSAIVLMCIVCGLVSQHDVDAASVPKPLTRAARVGDKSTEKCREYGKYVYEKPGEAASSEQECDIVDFHSRTDPHAKPKEFPHMAAIGYDGDNKEKLWRCSGSLISEQFVLTAAHCVNNYEYGAPKYIRIGDLVLNSDEDDAKPQEFQIAETFIHPDYKPSAVYNDIALIKIEKAANLNPYARPACLETSSNIGDVALLTSGWGNINHSSEFGPNMLMADFKQFTNSGCESSSKKPTSRNGIASTQLCAGPQTNTDVCLLATGGPLQAFNKDVFCTYKVVGLKSFGMACGHPDVPDVFTKVSAYVEWIEGIVWS